MRLSFLLAPCQLMKTVASRIFLVVGVASFALPGTAAEEESVPAPEGFTIREDEYFLGLGGLGFGHRVSGNDLPLSFVSWRPSLLFGAHSSWTYFEADVANLALAALSAGYQLVTGEALADVEGLVNVPAVDGGTLVLNDIRSLDTYAVFAGWGETAFQYGLSASLTWSAQAVSLPRQLDKPTYGGVVFAPGLGVGAIWDPLPRTRCVSGLMGHLGLSPEPEQLLSSVGASGHLDLFYSVVPGLLTLHGKSAIELRSFLEEKFDGDFIVGLTRVSLDVHW